jgi:glutamine synthetase
MLGFKSPEDCRRYMQEKDIRQFDVKFCDLIGSWHHITLLFNSIDGNMMEKGVGFDSSSVPRFRDIKSSDMAARPDFNACFIDDTFGEPILCSIADIVEAGTGEESTVDPRSVLKRALNYLRETGIGDEFTCAPELEFYLFSEAGFMNGPYEARFHIKAPGIGLQAGSGETGASKRLMEGKGYMAVHPRDWWQKERTKMAARLAEIGLPVRYHHVEVGAAGQQEIELGFSNALAAADGILLGKYFIRAIAVQNEIEACFMPKPIAGAAGNGLHIHFRLLKNKENLFAGPGSSGLSELGKYFVGGILKHGRSLLALFAPTTNSYKRLRHGHETAVRFFYSVANRESAIRIPKYSTGKNIRCEFRPGDPMMNPYLAMAGLLLAGIDGVKNKIDPTPLKFGPYDGAPEAIDPDEYPDCFLPLDLLQALKALEDDQDFLIEGNVFSEILINNYLSYKREEEVEPILSAPHPLEFEMYWGM